MAGSNHGPLALKGIGTYNAVNLLPQAHKLAGGNTIELLVSAKLLCQIELVGVADTQV